MEVSKLHNAPEVLLLRDFISESEIAHLMGLADGHFQSSKTVCTDPQGCISSYRTSSSAFLQSDGITSSIASRGKQFASLGFAEELQVVRYFKGQEFRPHLDAFDASSQIGQAELKKYGGRQRDATFLIYLNEPTLGGSTKFTKLNLEVSPSVGSAIFWRNTLSNGQIDSRTEHAGTPVLSGVKYAVNLWLRGQQTLGAVEAVEAAKQESKRTQVQVGETFSAEADGARFGVKVDRRKYTGTPHTLETMAKFIREGSTSLAMKQFAEMVVKAAGVEPSVFITNEAAAQILLDYVRKNVRYRPDPNQVEFVQSAPITLCIPGASICIPVGDCDDRVVALGSLMGAYGIPVKIVKQTFGENADEEHVFMIFETNSGKWSAADPSDPDEHPVGWSARASKEVVIDPLDPSNSGEQFQEFVGVGHLSGIKRLPSRVVFGEIRSIGVLDTPGDVLAYRTMWDPYIQAAVTACRTCSANWASQATGINVSQFAVSPDATTLQLWSNAQSENAAEIVREWNQFAGYQPYQILTFASEILQTLQATVLKVGQFYLPLVIRDCPNVVLPQPPSLDAQKYLLAQLEGDNIVTAGIMQLLKIGASGALETAEKIGEKAETLADKIVDALPWLFGAVGAAAVAYGVGQVVEIIKLESHVKDAKKEALETMRRVSSR